MGPIFTHIFTIPLLPNRIPLDSLSHFIPHIPFSDLYVLDKYNSTIVSSTSTEDKVPGRTKALYFPNLAAVKEKP
ncbi:hypothetical protein K443DRAFT_107446 [Laccaria amethystina LaAM-08-1]|uniref:Uncharacterized protein n=1 Tax=Laccaria amethystina LaAM-08-1 TaxID=1095629 RepID=A0A0C9WKG5_9AGAR|nr:hypothetical protein K443DRAFT_107446 [Laccaria amethystina LaAM-08-1]